MSTLFKDYLAKTIVFFFNFFTSRKVLNMQPVKKSFGLGIVLIMLLSTLPATQARADGWLGMLLKMSSKSPNHEKTSPIKDKILITSGAISIPILAYYARKAPAKVFWVLCGLIASPYFIDYMIRKPLKEGRFDSEILINGTWREKLLQIEYFISDVLLGWPYKPKKYVPKIINGKNVMVIQDEQYPSGYLGNIQAWGLVGAKTGLGLPITLVKQAKDLKDTVEFWTDPWGKSKEIFFPLPSTEN